MSDDRNENIAMPSAESRETSASSREDSTSLNMEGPMSLPVLPVRDAVVFNYMILPLFIGREKSVKAVETAIEHGRHMLVCAQREEDKDDPGPDDLYHVGTVVQIMRMLKMPDARIKILVQGVGRARVVAFKQTEPYLLAEVEPLTEESPTLDASLEALLRAARERSEKVLAARGISTPDILGVLQSVDDPGRLADLIASNLRLKMEQAQQLLEVLDPVERLRMVNELLAHELEVATMQAKIQGAAREGMDKAQKEFFLREQIKAIRHELGDSEEDGGEDLDNLKKSLASAGLSKEAMEEARKQLRRLAGMHADSSEATVIRSYLELMAELPWKKVTRDRLDIKRAKNILDEDHCGLDKVKDRILEYLSVRKLNPDSKGAILCFAGPPGVGKTSLGKSIARAMGRKFQRFSLGGMRDEAEIRGHRRTYIGSMPGRILQALKQAGSRNPLIVLDEVDKIGQDFRGDPSSALLEVLDPEQNHAFSDHYLNLPFDLSKVMFICTANHLENIPGPLRDRMEIISLPGYTLQEKVAIATGHLLPKQLEDAGLSEQDVEIAEDVIAEVARGYTREAGVRNLERELGSICRKLARKRAEGDKSKFTVTSGDLHDLLGAPRFLEDEKDRETLPGSAIGLAWTPAGGEVMNIEVNAVKGKGALLLTGQLGDVMKESAQAALSYIRGRAEDLGVDPGFASKKDIHVHVPAGATPKDGPSAGITLTTALISALSGMTARPDLCMTGEITLQGRVLPVGGIKEKILAGVARELKHVIIPYQNIKDLEEIPQELREKIEIHPVRHYDEVYPLVFGASWPGGGKKKRPAEDLEKREVKSGLAASPAENSKPRRKRKNAVTSAHPVF